MGSFRTKARAIELLGKKQIRDSVTGLSEIMKNSYDADARILRLEFNTTDKNPYIVIYDTGYGMDESDFENKWLVLGTESKKVSKRQKTPLGRTLMGEKGIGRLAVARLGQQTFLISKTKKSKWNMLYLNWNVFENPFLMIEDVLIPSRYNFEYDEIENVVNALIEEQKANLNNAAWKTEAYRSLGQKIYSQINNIMIPIDVLKDICELINSEEQQGTAIFIFDFNDDWDKYLSPEQKNEKDAITERNYNRLASFISDFQHVDKTFLVEVFYNGNIQEFNYDYDEKDYDMCDLKIEGFIEDGKFFGKLSARNADKQILDKCNRELQKGLEVTAGLRDWKSNDCGRFYVKLCHVELMERNSGLTTEEYQRIKGKMAVSGGIAVYRDNVRILPYGEVENDFLSLERRRTIKAGEYLFSHRNMFGRLDITSRSNPLLEDKSSREGLIENEQFFYFLTTMQNLLIRIAREYITDVSNSKSLRKSYLAYNNKKAAQKENKEKLEKEENRLLNEYRKLLLDKFKANENQFLTEKKLIEKEMSELSKQFITDESMSYLQLNTLHNRFEDCKIKLKFMINNINKLIIIIDRRYLSSIKENEIQAIDELNNDIKRYTELLEADLNETSQDIEHNIRLFIDAWWNKISDGFDGSPTEYVNQLTASVSETISKHNSFLKELQHFCKKREDNIRIKISSINKFESEINRTHSTIQGQFLTKSEAITSDLQEMQKLCHNLLNMSPSEMQKARFNIYSTLHKYKYILEDNYYETIKYSEKQFDQLDAKAELFQFYSSSDNLNNVNNMVGLLKQKNIELENELEIFTELANLGLSAEIVNHEFNQLFTNVYDAIKQMKYEPLNNMAKYLLKQIEIGFRAISDRQSQLSPMYRSRNINNMPVSIKTMLDDIYNFFEDKFKNNNIKFINKVHEDTILVLSLSKIYPVLSNLIYNSIYWVADREERIILFHFDIEENSFYIEDSGPGIPLKYIKKIFDPFFSLKPDGRGLGLTIAKKVLESQGHTIEVIAEGKNKFLSGACFRIQFNTENTSPERGE